MSGDRFKMIASEMLYEPEAAAVTKAGLIFDGGNLTCGRCGNSAFEPSPSYMRCLGCPLTDRPSQIYAFPVGFTLTMEVNRYRCGGCGKQSQVTMTLSDVNLWCGGCGKLQLHERMMQPPKRTLTKEAQQRLDTKVVQAVARAGRERDDLFGVPRYRSPRQGPLLIDDFRRKLGLEDFDEFAVRARKRNAQLVLDEKYVGADLDRRTGRTTRGILEMLARCVEKQATQIWVVAHSRRYEDDLMKQIRNVTIKLDVAVRDGIRIRPLPPGPEPRGVVTYTDHTYRELSSEQQRIIDRYVNGR